MEDKKIERRVVHAVGIVGSTSMHGVEASKYLEEAQKKAIQQALADGVKITDTEEIKQRLALTLENVKRELGIS